MELPALPLPATSEMGLVMAAETTPAAEAVMEFER